MIIYITKSRIPLYNRIQLIILTTILNSLMFVDLRTYTHYIQLHLLTH